MVFGVEFRQVEGNVESVLTDPGLFPVQVCETGEATQEECTSSDL